MEITKSMRINQRIRERVLRLAHYVLETKSTVRQAAKVHGVSKSTVHKDLTDRLKLVDPILYKKVRELLDYHLDVRHIRGGIATQMNFKRTHSNSEEVVAS